MKLLRIAALGLCLAALAAILLCIFTDWNDSLFLPLGLCLSVVGNGLNLLANRRHKDGKEAGQ